MRNATQRITLRRIASILTIPLLVAAPLGLSQPGNADPKITVSAQDKNVPSELNPPFASPQPVVPPTLPRHRPPPSRGRNSSPSTGRPCHSLESRASATRHPPPA